MKKILLIEHDADVRAMISYILEDEGWAVVTMQEPEKLQAVAELRPDLVLIDEWLSGRPGHRLCLRIKQFEQLLHVPVIILSTSNDIGQIALDCRADDYIRKPFDLAELVDKVKRYLQAHEQHH